MGKGVQQAGTVEWVKGCNRYKGNRQGGAMGTGEWAGGTRLLYAHVPDPTRQVDT